MMKNIVRLFVCPLLLFSAVTQAEPVLTITTEQWPPNNYVDEQGNIVGTATQKVRAILSKARLKYEIQMLPWARAYHKALNEPNTAIYSIVRNKVREPLFQWVCPLTAPATIYLFRHASRTDIKINRIEDVRNYMISVSKNEFDHLFLESHGLVADKDFYVSFDDKTNVRKLLSGRIDLVIGTESAVYDNARTQGFKVEDLAKVQKIVLPENNATCLAFSLKTPKETVEKVRKALIDSNK